MKRAPFVVLAFAVLSGCMTVVDPAPAASGTAEAVDGLAPQSALALKGSGTCAPRGVSLKSEGTACAHLNDTCSLTAADGAYECGCVVQTCDGLAPPIPGAPPLPPQTWTCRKTVPGCPSPFSGTNPPDPSNACSFKNATCPFVIGSCASCEEHCSAAGKVDQVGCVG
jgi:hypothetical protein